MVDVKELRLGNAVRWIGQSKIYFVEFISAPDENYPIGALDTDLMSERSAEEYEGVLLTPELLEWCGLVKHGNYWYLDNKNAIGYNPQFGFYHQATDVIIYSLHQLQNLVHALTGEELIIT